MRLLDHYQDYSTTRGPMTAYDVLVCDECGQLTLSRRAAQTTRS